MDPWKGSRSPPALKTQGFSPRGRLLLLTPARKEAFADARRREARFVLAPYLFRQPSPFRQILLHRGSVLQVIADDRMDIGEAERVILTNDLFRARPVLILPHDGVQGHARFSHEQVAIDVEPKGWRLGDQGLGDG